jgi:hypothetical protein
MGKRWWQKEARANAEKARQAAKAARVATVPVIANDNVSADSIFTDEAIVDSTTVEVTDSIDESVEILTQAVEDVNIDSDVDVSQDEVVTDEVTDAQADDVKVPGITITHNHNAYQNIKKKRR